MKTLNIELEELKEKQIKAKGYFPEIYVVDVPFVERLIKKARQEGINEERKRIVELINESKKSLGSYDIVSNSLLNTLIKDIEGEK